VHFDQEGNDGTTHRAAYIASVLQTCEVEAHLPEVSRIYLLFQEGISTQQTQRICETHQERTDTGLPQTYKL
jgi:hypothetical protein